jgi:hypothetical protein
MFNYVKFVATKKVWQQIFFSPPSFADVFGSGIRHGKNQDPGSGINIPDPQDWLFYSWIQDEHPGSYFQELRNSLLG